MIKKMVLIVMSMMLVVCQSGCRRTDGMYSGKYKAELSSMQSSLINSDLTIQHEYKNIDILEKDMYGRSLFISFSNLQVVPETSENEKREKSEQENLMVVSLGIIQKSDIDVENGYVYYYEDINFIRKDFVAFSSGEYYAKDNVDLFTNLLERFAIDESAQLKEENDWDKPLDESKMSKVKIFWEKKDIIPMSKRKKVYKTLCDDLKTTENWLFRKIYDFISSDWIFNESYLVSDKNGKSIYFFRDGYWEKGQTDKDESVYIYTTPYLIMFDKDGEVIPETGILELDDSLDYSCYTDDLIEFKEANDWDMSA